MLSTAAILTAVPPVPHSDALRDERLSALRYTLRVCSRPSDAATSDIVLHSFVLEERLHEPYTLRIAAVGEEELDLEALLGARVDLEITRGDTRRMVHGVVLEHECVSANEDGLEVRLYVGPALELLKLHLRHRIFQGRTVPEIVREVAEPLLVEQGSALVLDQLTRSYAPRDYCVQYRETDLAFVLRILAESGITLLFDHSGDAEVVVLVDSKESFPSAGREPLGVRPAATPSSSRLAPSDPVRLPVGGFRTLRWRSRLQWSGVGDWKGPSGCHVADTAELHAASDAMVLRAGSVFALEEEPQAGRETAWVVQRVRHFGEVDRGSGEPVAVEYCNELEARSLRLPVVPPRSLRPRVDGVQTAIVIGPPDEEVHTDRLGRIRVRLPWGDATGDGEHSSCWVRVMMPWPGDELGLVCLPRMGAEVVLSFRDGDPDQPLCIGVLEEGTPNVGGSMRYGIFEVDAADAIVLRCGSSRIELGREKITLEASGIDVMTDDLRQYVGSAQVSADTAIVLGIGPSAAEAALALSARGIMAHAKGRFDAKADEVCVLGTSSLGLGGGITGVRGREVAIDAERGIEITSRGPVDVIANDEAATH